MASALVKRTEADLLRIIARSRNQQEVAQARRELADLPASERSGRFELSPADTRKVTDRFRPRIAGQVSQGAITSLIQVGDTGGAASLAEITAAQEKAKAPFEQLGAGLASQFTKDRNLPSVPSLGVAEPPTADEATLAAERKFGGGKFGIPGDALALFLGTYGPNLRTGRQRDTARFESQQREASEQSQLRQQGIRAGIRKEQAELNVGGTSAIIRGIGPVLIEQELVSVDPETQKLTGDKVFEKIIAQVTKVPNGPVAQTLVKLIVKHLPQILPKGKDGKPDIKSPEAVQQAIAIFSKVLSQTANSGSDAVRDQLGRAFDAAGLDLNNFDQLFKRAEQEARIARKSAALERKTIRGEQGARAQETAGGFTNERLLELERLGGLNLPRQPAPTTETPPTLTQEALPATPKFGVEPSITETNIGGGVETPAPRLETQALTTSDLTAATAPAPEVDILNPVRLVADAIPNKIAKKQLTQQEALFLTNINAAVTTSNINEKAKLKFTAANIVDNIRTVATTMRLKEGVDYSLPKLTGRETPGQIQLMGETILDFLQTSFNEKKAGERVTNKPLTANQLKQRQDHRNNELIYSVVETLIKDDIQPGSKQFNKIAQQALDDFRADRQGTGDKADYFGSPKEVEALMTDADVASGFSQALVDRLRAEPYNIANPQRDATGLQARDARADIFKDKLALVREEVQTKADLKALEEAGPIIFVIERMQGLVQGLLTNDVYWKRLFTDGIKNSINEIMQWSPEAAAYADERQAFATVLARAVESGRISDQDRLAFLNLIAETSGFFPDSLEKANMVFATVRQLFLRKVSPRVRQLLEADKDLRGEQLATDMEDILKAARKKIGIK